MKKTILSLAAALVLSVSAFAEGSTMFNGSTNIQLFYDFSPDRQLVTTTLEGFYSDPWGNTFFFVDHDFLPGGSRNNPDGSNTALDGTYWEIARCLNFWQNSAIKDLSLQVEYNGGRYRQYGINHAFLAGLDYFLHSSDYKNCFNFKLLYKHILYSDSYLNPAAAALGLETINMGHKTMVPLQFTFVWGMQDLFGAPGLRFSGFLDVWGEDHYVFDTNMGTGDRSNLQLSHFVMITEPQIWYAVGQHFGCPNLNVGTEIEMSVNFGECKGFKCRPCLGVKWIF